MKIQLNTAVTPINNYSKKETAFGSKTSTFELSEEKLIEKAKEFGFSSKRTQENVRDGIAKLRALYKRFRRSKICDIHISGTEPNDISVRLTPSPKVLAEAKEGKFNPKQLCVFERDYRPELMDRMVRVENVDMVLAAIRRDVRDNKIVYSRGKKHTTTK